MSAGLLLVGGSGTRLLPLTRHTSKHLLRVGGRPMVHHSLDTLVRAGCDSIRLVCNPGDEHAYLQALDVPRYAHCHFSVTVQPRPGGIAQAVALAADHCEDGVVVGLGDNLLHGAGASSFLADFRASSGAMLVTCRVADPRDYGVAEVDGSGRVRSLEEKPAHPRSDRAIVGLYALDGTVVERVRGLTPSPRGELEMVDLLDRYRQDDALRAVALPEDVVWMDLGTHEALARADALLAEAQPSS